MNGLLRLLTDPEPAARAYQGLFLGQVKDDKRRARVRAKLEYYKDRVRIHAASELGEMDIEAAGAVHHLMP